MKYEVKLYIGGKVFTEEVHANNNQDAKVTALARNPTAKVIGVNVSFKKSIKSWAPESVPIV